MCLFDVLAWSCFILQEICYVFLWIGVCGIMFAYHPTCYHCLLILIGTVTAGYAIYLFVYYVCREIIVVFVAAFWLEHANSECDLVILLLGIPDIANTSGRNSWSLWRENSCCLCHWGQFSNIYFGSHSRWLCEIFYQYNYFNIVGIFLSHCRQLCIQIFDCSLLYNFEINYNPLCMAFLK